MTLSRTFRGFSRRELWLYALILLLALTTRFWLLGERVMSHDESLHTRYATTSTPTDPFSTHP